MSWARFSDTGSSPRIRGECTWGGGFVKTSRIIPANTGRIHGLHGAASRHGDHPREYGENKDTAPSKVANAGSSPRIRGE